MHGRDRRFVTSLLRDRFTPAVVTARNILGTHKNSAVCPFTDRNVLRGLRKLEDTRDIDFVIQNFGTGACGVVIGANDHRMDFCLVHITAK